MYKKIIKNFSFHSKQQYTDVITSIIQPKFDLKQNKSKFPMLYDKVKTFCWLKSFVFLFASETREGISPRIL